jgi:hypothetical protein
MRRFPTRAATAVTAIAAVVVVAILLTNHSAPRTQIHSAQLNETWQTTQTFSEDRGSGERYGGRQCWYDSDVPQCE